MSNMMIYATTDKVGGNIESVWGYKMRVRTIDSGDKELAETLQAEGWMPKADDVIEQIETEKLEAENKVMKGVLTSKADEDRINELEEQLTTALEEIAGFEQEREESDKVINEKIARIAELEQKLAIYEESKDANGDGAVSYDEMTIPILSTLLKNRKVDHNVRDGKDALIKLAQDSE